MQRRQDGSLQLLLRRPFTRRRLELWVVLGWLPEYEPGKFAYLREHRSAGIKQTPQGYRQGNRQDKGLAD
jgi:hypothetical protein